MEKLTIEMPKVEQCDVNECGFNVDNNCHAKAITIGDYSNPGCDTFMDTDQHTNESVRIAGVGACKVNSCKFNEDYECMAQNIAVGFNKGKVNCLTFSPEA
ncbi:MAG: DUF1540 domain-containing protein [Bacteriovoracia bacterium]